MQGSSGAINKILQAWLRGFCSSIFLASALLASPLHQKMPLFGLDVEFAVYEAASARECKPAEMGPNEDNYSGSCYCMQHMNGQVLIITYMEQEPSPKRQIETEMS